MEKKMIKIIFECLQITLSLLSYSLHDRSMNYIFFTRTNTTSKLTRKVEIAGHYEKIFQFNNITLTVVLGLFDVL